MRRDHPDTTVIIPTLNEEDNIARVIATMVRMYPKISIIVADDGSKDSTKRMVERIAAKNGRVRLLDRYASAVHGVTASILDAVMIVKTRKTILMDADFQHSPGKAGEMATALDRSDIVVGVRKGPGKRSFSRRFLSKGLIYLSLAVFRLRGLPTCGDMASGFIGFRTEMLKGLASNNRSEFVGRGNKLLLDALRIIDSNTRIAEVGYPNFSERKSGKSKMSYRIIFLSLESVLR